MTNPENEAADEDAREAEAAEIQLRMVKKELERQLLEQIEKPAQLPWWKRLARHIARRDFRVRHHS